MAKYRKKTPLIDATQWYPQDGSEQDESEIVQPYRVIDALDALDALGLDHEENQYCPHCGNRMFRHGVLDGVNGVEYVCPSDYIVPDRSGSYRRLSRGEFESQYEIYARPPRFPEVPMSDLEKRKQSRKSMRN